MVANDFIHLAPTHPWDGHNRNMYAFGSTFLKKEDYGEIVNDLYKVDLPYAKVLRCTKEQMMMDDGRTSLPCKHYYAKLIGGGTGIYSNPIERTGSYKLSDQDVIEGIRESNSKRLFLEYKQEYLANLLFITEQSKKRDEERKKELLRMQKERLFAIFIQRKISRELAIFMNVYSLMSFYRVYFQGVQE